MPKFKMIVRIGSCLAVVILFGLMSATALRLYAAREIDALNFLLAFGGCGLAAFLFAGLLLDSPESNTLSILETPTTPTSARARRPMQPVDFRRWFGGLGDAA